MTACTPIHGQEGLPRPSAARSRLRESKWPAVWSFNSGAAPEASARSRAHLPAADCALVRGASGRRRGQKGTGRGSCAQSLHLSVTTQKCWVAIGAVPP